MRICGGWSRGAVGVNEGEQGMADAAGICGASRRLLWRRCPSVPPCIRRSPLWRFASRWQGSCWPASSGPWGAVPASVSYSRRCCPSLCQKQRERDNKMAEFTASMKSKTVSSAPSLLLALQRRLPCAPITPAAALSVLLLSHPHYSSVAIVHLVRVVDGNSCLLPPLDCLDILEKLLGIPPYLCGGSDFNAETTFDMPDATAQQQAQLLLAPLHQTLAMCILHHAIDLLQSPPGAAEAAATVTCQGRATPGSGVHLLRVAALLYEFTASCAASSDGVFARQLLGYVEVHVTHPVVRLLYRLAVQAGGSLAADPWHPFSVAEAAALSLWWSYFILRLNPTTVSVPHQEFLQRSWLLSLNDVDETLSRFCSVAPRGQGWRCWQCLRAIHWLLLHVIPVMHDCSIHDACLRVGRHVATLAAAVLSSASMLHCGGASDALPANFAGEIRNGGMRAEQQLVVYRVVVGVAYRLVLQSVAESTTLSGLRSLLQSCRNMTGKPRGRATLSTLCDRLPSSELATVVRRLLEVVLHASCGVLALDEDTWIKLSVVVHFISSESSHQILHGSSSTTTNANCASGCTLAAIRRCLLDGAFDYLAALAVKATDCGGVDATFKVASRVAAVEDVGSASFIVVNLPTTRLCSPLVRGSNPLSTTTAALPCSLEFIYCLFLSWCCWDSPSLSRCCCVSLPSPSQGHTQKRRVSAAAASSTDRWSSLLLSAWSNALDTVTSLNPLHVVTAISVFAAVELEMTTTASSSNSFEASSDTAARCQAMDRRRMAFCASCLLHQCENWYLSHVELHSMTAYQRPLPRSNDTLEFVPSAAKRPFHSSSHSPYFLPALVSASAQHGHDMRWRTLYQTGNASAAVGATSTGTTNRNSIYESLLYRAVLPLSAELTSMRLTTARCYVDCCRQLGISLYSADWKPFGTPSPVRCYDRLVPFLLAVEGLPVPVVLSELPSLPLLTLMKFWCGAKGRASPAAYSTSVYPFFRSQLPNLQREKAVLPESQSLNDNQETSRCLHHSPRDSSPLHHLGGAVSLLRTAFEDGVGQYAGRLLVFSLNCRIGCSDVEPLLPPKAPHSSPAGCLHGSVPAPAVALGSRHLSSSPWSCYGASWYRDNVCCNGIGRGFAAPDVEVLWPVLHGYFSCASQLIDNDAWQHLRQLGQHWVARSDGSWCGTGGVSCSDYMREIVRRVCTAQRDGEWPTTALGQTFLWQLTPKELARCCEWAAIYRAFVGGERTPACVLEATTAMGRDGPCSTLECDELLTLFSTLPELICCSGHDTALSFVLQRLWKARWCSVTAVLQRCTCELDAPEGLMKVIDLLLLWRQILVAVQRVHQLLSELALYRLCHFQFAASAKSPPPPPPQLLLGLLERTPIEELDLQCHDYWMAVGCPITTFTSASKETFQALQAYGADARSPLWQSWWCGLLPDGETDTIVQLLLSRVQLTVHHNTH